jgi:hypothetical protein
MKTKATHATQAGQREVVSMASASRDPCRTPWRVRALAALAGGELAGAAEKILEEHARACGTCGPRLASLRAQRDLLLAQAGARLAQVDLSGFTERVMGAVASDTERPSLPERAKVISLEQWRARPVAWVAGLSAAACVLFALALRPGPAKVAAPELLLAQASVDFLELDGQAGTVMESPGRTTVIWVQDTPEGGEEQR